jgi:hypothetical protein
MNYELWIMDYEFSITFFNMFPSLPEFLPLEKRGETRGVG